jgi:hypothetical protein
MARRVRLVRLVTIDAKRAAVNFVEPEQLA